jgi:hypothetical protein
MVGEPKEFVMDGSYAKVFRTMFTGSMYGAGLHVFATWAWVLTHKDEHGLVEVNTKLVAAELGAEVDQIEQAIAYLTAPDPESRSHEEDGCRMVRVSQFGYRVVNHAKYRDHGKNRTEYWRDYKANKRSESQKNDGCPQMSTNVHSGQSGHSTKSTHADADADADAKDKETTITTPARETFASPDSDVVRKNAPKLLELWNSFAPKPVRSALEEMAIERAYSMLVLGIPPNRLCPEQVMGAVENYREAISLPSSQAPPLALGRFLSWEIVSKYLPGNFTLENYDKTRFGRDRSKSGESEVRLEELKRLGVL